MKKILLLISALIVLSLCSDALSVASSITVNSKKFVSMGNKKAVIADLTIVGGTYSSGIPLTAANLGMTKIESFLANSDDGYLYEYDIANAKLKQFGTADVVVDATTSTTIIDTASPDGTLLYVWTQDYRFGTFVADTDADTSIIWSSGVYAGIIDYDTPASFHNDMTAVDAPNGGLTFAVNGNDSVTTPRLRFNNTVTGTNL